MAEQSDPESKDEKKFKIRPRLMENEKEEKAEEKEEGPKHKIRAGRNPFPAKAMERAREDAGKKTEAVEKSAEKNAEEEEGVSPKPRDEERVRKERKRKADTEELGKKVVAFLKNLPGREVRLWPCVVIGLAAVVFFSWMSKRSGLTEGREEGLKEAQEKITRAKAEVPAEAGRELNEALFALRRGDAAKALKTLQGLEDRRREYASMSYLVALAAMQNGDIPLAEQKVLETIAKGERVSDALALQSVLETQKAADRSMAVMGDPKVRSEALLRQAMVADAANPYPHFELATLLRYKGEREEAIAEIKAAQARLNPMDSHLVMDVTLSLINLELQPDTGGVASLESDDARKLLPSAYTAMTRGQFGLAAAILEKCQKLLAPDVFDYLVNDPAFRRYAREKELAKFYGN